MNPIVLQILKWVIEKLVVEASKKVDWAEVKKEVDARIDALLPGVVYDAMAKFMVNHMIDLIAEYLGKMHSPVTPDAVSQAVEHANKSLAGRFAMELMRRLAAEVAA
jgi:hypothetical protein